MTARLVKLAAVVLGAAVLAGCGDGGDGGNDGDRPGGGPPPSPAPKEITMTLDRRVAKPGARLRLTVHNRGDARVEYGLAYRLERWDGADWEWLNRDAAFALILKVAEPGAREDERIELPGDARRGRYRIVKEFTVQPAGRRFEAEVRLAVR